MTVIVINSYHILICTCIPHSAGLDYISGVNLTTLVFPPGATLGAIVVPIIDDESAEPTEFFRINLLPVQDVILTDAAQATVFIEDDDG